MSLSSSAFFAAVLAISSSQYAFSVASESASASSFAIMSEIKPFTFAKTSSPLAAPYFITAPMREASCARAAEWLSLAKRFTAITTSAPLRSARVCSFEPDAVWSSEYVWDTAPELDSWRIFLASAIVFNSSLRAATVDSWSAATVRQVDCAVASSSFAWARAFTVLSRSPSAVALPSSAAALAAFSSDRSLLSAATWSSRDCFSIAKLCFEFVSALRRSLSWPSAFSFRSSSTSRMPPLCDL
mmetsp:Transcript_83712/g.115457  ORF Transcript_83712/g.115457 Transcript_83712/m.115457 type:complete len:243 (-) Transcript_83712:33-761(-)